jgi:hypothetical protein
MHEEDEKWIQDCKQVIIDENDIKQILKETEEDVVGCI